MSFFCKKSKFNNTLNNPKITLDTYLDKGMDEFKNTDKKELTELELDNLKTSFIDETTPAGVVKLYYDKYSEAFHYYSDEDIPYKYLEVVARLFVIKYNCSSLYINYIEELLKAKDLKLKNNANTVSVNKLYMISKNKNLPENSEIYIVPEKSNKYIKKGKLKDLIEEEKIKQRTKIKEENIKNISFKDFKRK